MVYLTSDGRVVEKRSMWRLSIVPDLLWGVADFFWLFVQTLIQPNSEHHSLRPTRTRGGGATGGARPSSGGKGVRGLKDVSSSSMKATGAGG